jgi:hypothetical protein
MLKRVCVALGILGTTVACSSVDRVTSLNPLSHNKASSYSAYADEADVRGYVSSVRVEAPSQCFTSEQQTGKPVSFYRGAIIDQPRLVHREMLGVPARPRANRNFYCAAFYYSVDERGQVTDIQTLYNSHPDVGGINFARDAKRTLRQWRYDPGLVDKGRTKFTGFTTVFYYGFEG